MNDEHSRIVSRKLAANFLVKDVKVFIELESAVYLSSPEGSRDAHVKESGEMPNHFELLKQPQFLHNATMVEDLSVPEL